MNKLILAAALAFTVSAGAASAQQFANLTPAPSDSDSMVFRQAPLHREHASGLRTYSAEARNVGPTSSVTGYAETDMGSAASGDDSNARAPAAGGNGMGGN